MNVRDKCRFIRELTSSIREAALDRVKDMPEEWDGLELRYYLAEKFEDAKTRMAPGRVLDYREAMVEKNL